MGSIKEGEENKNDDNNNKVWVETQAAERVG